MASYKHLSGDIEADFITRFKIWFLEDPCHEPLNILITGKTGVGKSRLVNALVGRKVAKEGHSKDPCTSEVTCYQVDIEGVPVTVWDSPGLQDEATNEARYIEDMKRKIKDVALMIYCIKMDDTRFYDADKKAIETLKKEFGKGVWNHAVVALTFANKVEDPDKEGDLHVQYFKEQLKEWKKQIRKNLVAVGLNPDECRSIPVLPVGNRVKSMCLPDRKNWLSDLWIKSYQVMKASARRGMYRINRHRLKSMSSPNSTLTPTPAPATTTIATVSTASASTTAADTTTTTTTATTTTEEDDIACEIPLNEKQQKSFWKAAWEAFIKCVCRIAPAASVSVLWEILNDLVF